MTTKTKTDKWLKRVVGWALWAGFGLILASLAWVAATGNKEGSETLAQTGVAVMALTLLIYTLARLWDALAAHPVITALVLTGVLAIPGLKAQGLDALPALGIVAAVLMGIGFLLKDARQTLPGKRTHVRGWRWGFRWVEPGVPTERSGLVAAMRGSPSAAFKHGLD